MRRVLATLGNQSDCFPSLLFGGDHEQESGRARHLLDGRPAPLSACRCHASASKSSLVIRSDLARFRFPRARARSRFKKKDKLKKKKKNSLGIVLKLSACRRASVVDVVFGRSAFAASAKPSCAWRLVADQRNARPPPATATIPGIPYRLQPGCRIVFALLEEVDDVDPSRCGGHRTVRRHLGVPPACMMTKVKRRLRAAVAWRRWVSA